MTGNSEALSTLELGTRIERRAELWFLETVGGRLLERNYRIRGGEIDLIFELDREVERELVFVEVRARLPGNWVGGLESIRGPKQRRLRRAIRHYLAQYRGNALATRVDVLDWNGLCFMHYENVWI